MDVDLADPRWIAGDVEDEEEAESADVYVEHLELREVEERLSRRPALPPLPPPPRRRTSHAAAEVERQLNEILKGICVKGRFSVQSSNERSDTVARASLVVEEGPSELLNRVVRVYSLKDRNRAKQGDHVWVELRSCVLDRAALERGGPGTWTMSQALSYVCIFGAVLRATPPMGVAARSCYLCKQSQMQWKPGVLNFIPFSHEVPMLQVMVEREEREQPLDDVFQLAMVDWPVNRLRPLAVIVERLAVPRPLSLERSLEIFLKDLDFLQDPEDPKVQEMADEAVDLMTPEEELNIIDAQRRELDGQIFSIDAAGANIIDDALEYDLEEQVVRVHIADVAASVCSGGDLDLYAARRGCSVFIRDHKEELQRCEPMLPACVTFQTSLDKNQWRRALSFEFRVGEQLQFLGFFRSWVRSKEQLSFQAAEGLMSGTDTGTRTPPGVLRSLRALWQWTRAELEKRKARGRVAALQAFLSTASARNSQEGDAESLVEFWTRQVNEESGRILATSCDISYCFPCPDAHHFSRLAVLCREALLRAGDVAQDELLLKLRSSPEECQESLAEILSHVTRLSTSTQRGPNRWGSTARAATGEVTQGVSVLCQQLSQCVPIAQYRVKSSGDTQWPILQQSQHYFQVTSPMRRWIDLLGQHLLLGTCELDFEEMAQYVESFNEMSLLAKQTSSRFAFLSFCGELQQSEKQMECVVSRIDQGTLHLACPDIAGFHRTHMVLPLQLLSSHDLQVRPIIEEKKAIVTRVEDAKQLELRPFHSKMQVQLGLDQSSPVSLYRLCASALFLDFRDGSRKFRHAVLPRQHPEVFGPVPDLRKAREMHRAGGLWGSTWQQVRQAQMCAAALMPQMRAKAPYHMTASYEELENNFCFVGNRSEGYEVYVTVPSSYRGLRGLTKLQVGHLALLWRSDRDRGRLWMCCGAVKNVDITRQMRRKTELCPRFARNGTCEYEDCWYAHGSNELVPERAKVTVRLSDCSARLLPSWVTSNSGTLDVDFAVISSREQLALKSIREVEKTSERQPQQLVKRLVFRGRGAFSFDGPPAIADEAPIDTPAGLPPLNNYQQRALQLTLKEVLAYVQGPPGTGKSTTAAHLICQLLRRQRWGAAVKPLMVCCPSNKACDRLLHLFLKAEMSRNIWVVRVYAKTIEQNYWRDPRSQCCRDYEIDPDLLQYALHQQVEDQDPSIKNQYLDVAQQLEDHCTKPGELLTLQKTLNEAKQLKESKSKEILKQAQVIFTTCDCACNDRLFQRMSFPSVIIDEAAQALEPELARCCLLAEDHLALFGDHEQLGPVLTEQTLFPAFKNMWTRSLFERIVSKRPGRGQSNSLTTGIPHVTLKRQYRMHPSISCFANEEFYQCQLVDDEEACRDGFTLPSEFNSRMSVIDVTGPHGRKSVAPEGDAVQDFETSLCNPSEAAVVKAYVTWLVALGVSVGEIGVVTPYRAQAALIKEVLTEALSNEELPTIGTVHLLQGEERQYVILSLVRSFAEADTEVFDPVPQDARRRKVYSLGFLNDRRLANVALTRAQLGLVVVANTQVLSSAPHWKNLFEHARSNRCYWDQDAAMDFFQDGEATGPADSYWAEVRSQSPLPSGSESEGHAEASEASEASAFGSAPPSSAASDAEGETEVPAPAAPVAPVAPVARARRRRGKRSKAKAKAKARGRAPEAEEILEEALAETGAPLSPDATERTAPAVCCVEDCRNRPHQRSPFACAHGLCSAHYKELLKEKDFLEQQEVEGPVSSMERFILPTYWNPLPPIAEEKKLRSRSFFSVLLRYLETSKTPTSPSLDVLFTLAFTASIRSAHELQISPEEFLHTEAIGLLLALQAIEDCAGQVPSHFQERWQQLSGQNQGQQSQQRYQEDILAIAAFWKEEGNRHKQQRQLVGEFQLALDSYAFGSQLLEELPISPPVARLAADLANNASAAYIDVEDYPSAEQSALSAISYFDQLTDPALPKKAKAFYRRGVALHRLGRLQESVTDLTCALRTCPEDEIRNRLVIVQGELERAERRGEGDEGDW